MTHPNHTLVVLDPSSNWGEVALDDAMSSGDDAVVTLFTVLSGPAAFALAEYAADAGVSIGEAGDVYLEQVGERVASRGTTVAGEITADGDVAAAIATAATEAGAALVAIPAGNRIVDEHHLGEVLAAAGIALRIVPVGSMSAA